MKISGTLAAVVLVACLLAGCGGNGSRAEMNGETARFNRDLMYQAAVAASLSGNMPMDKVRAAAEAYREAEVELERAKARDRGRKLTRDEERRADCKARVAALAIVSGAYDDRRLDSSGIERERKSLDCR